MNSNTRANPQPAWRSRLADESIISVNHMDHWIDSQKELVLDVDLPRVRVTSDSTSGEIHLELENYRVALTNWSFWQIARIVRAPARYLLSLPPKLAAECLQFSFNHSGRQAKFLCRDIDKGSVQLRNAYNPRYHRTSETAIVRLAKRIVRKNLGGGNWKTPRELNWLSVTGLNISEDLINESTGMYISDRYVSIFLINESRNSIVNVNNQIYAWGIHIWTHKQKFGFSFFFFRASCQNRQLWEVINRFGYEFPLREGNFDKFEIALEKELSEFPNKGVGDFSHQISLSQQNRVAENKDDALRVLVVLGFQNDVAHSIIESFLNGNESDSSNRFPVSAFDLIQAITAYARRITMQDERLYVEANAFRLLNPRHYSHPYWHDPHPDLMRPMPSIPVTRVT